MKKSNLLFLSALILLVPALVFATDWNKPDHGYFKYQKDIDKSMSGALTATMASINYNEKVFNFANYHDGDGIASKGKIILRKLTNDGSGTIDWSFKKYDDIEHLKDLGVFDWQPAPVVFNDQLYIFVGNKTSNASNYKGGISYSTYNSGADSWSSLKEVTTSELGEGMAAVVINKMICLVFRDADREIHILSSSDLKTWNKFTISDKYSSSVHQQVSAITSSYKLHGKKVDKLVFAIIDDNENAKCYEYYYDSLNTSQKWIQISKRTISNENNYQSVALAEGTVYGDPSTGKCIQAFLKVDNKDNGYCRYRIKRYQIKDNETSWTEQEYNLVPQTSPKRMWASKDVNLTAVNVPVFDGYDIRQYMCLFYRGYDDWDYPLNCAWAETDKMVYYPDGDIYPITLEDPENTLYVGYIEGPPPFYLNDSTNMANREDPYKKGGDGSGEPISKIEYTYTKSSSTETEYGFKTGVEAKFERLYFRTEFEYMFGKKWITEQTWEEIHSISPEAISEGYGYYICYSPIIDRKQYFLKDVHNNILDTIIYAYISDVKYSYQHVKLQEGLIPKDPTTYQNRVGINFNKYAENRIYKSSNNSEIGAPTFCTVKMEKKELETTSHEFTWKVGIGAEHIGELLGVGSFDCKITTSTKIGTEFTATSNLNEPKNPDDITELFYDVHWIKPVKGQSNWWLPKGAEKQNTWCITYDVTQIKRLEGKINKMKDDSENTENQTNFNADVLELNTIDESSSTIKNGEVPSPSDISSDYSLLQNFPNPFNTSTKITYSIGKNISNPSASFLTRLVVSDIYGNEVAVLVNENQKSGTYSTIWEASHVPAGIYFYKLQSGNFSTTKKLILAK